ncbi:arginase family protein [Actinomycetes bacterium KLBMP 9797]
MSLSVLVVPQWQGSGSRTAHRLWRGAAELAALIPAAERVTVDVDAPPGPARDGVTAHDALVANLRATRTALAGLDGRPVVTVGGDCGVDLAPIEAALAAHGERLAVVWFDAHGDLNTPASSPSGAFHGMVLRTLLGDGPPSLVPAQPLRPDRLVLAGVRALDPAERDFIAAHAVRHVAAPALAEPSTVVDAVAATGADTVYVHIDLDVLDPDGFASVGTPEPGGVTADQLAAAVRALAGRFTLAGLAITEYEPSRAADHVVLEELLPMIKASL